MKTLGFIPVEETRSVPLQSEMYQTPIPLILLQSFKISLWHIGLYGGINKGIVWQWPLPARWPASFAGIRVLCFKPSWASPHAVCHRCLSHWIPVSLTPPVIPLGRSANPYRSRLRTVLLRVRKVGVYSPIDAPRGLGVSDGSCNTLAFLACPGQWAKPLLWPEDALRQRGTVLFSISGGLGDKQRWPGQARTDSATSVKKISKMISLRL